MKMIAAAVAALVLATPPQANLKFSFKDINGKKVALSEFKGKVIILDFWATWCVPCKAEIPGFIQLQKKYGDQGLQIIGVSVDDAAGTAKKYSDEMKMNYPILLAEGKEDILKAYDPIPSIPVSVVIDRQGRIAARHLGVAPMAVFEKEISALLSPSSP
jgi:thiol-disulfide isomerase/thioredoxin